MSVKLAFRAFSDGPALWLFSTARSAWGATGTHRRRPRGGVFAVDLHLVLDEYLLEQATILGQRSWESFGWLSSEGFWLIVTSME